MASTEGNDAADPNEEAEDTTENGKDRKEATNTSNKAQPVDQVETPVSNNTRPKRSRKVIDKDL